MAIEMIEEFDQGTQIKVIGVGGGGGNAVQHMISQGVQGVDFIVANTDAQALNRSNASTLVAAGALPHLVGMLQHSETAEDIAADRLLWGDPERVIDQIRGYRASTGCTHVHAAFGAGLPADTGQASLGSFDDIAAMIRLFGTEVVPAFA